MRRLGAKKRSKRRLLIAGCLIAFLIYTVYWLFLFENLRRNIGVSLRNNGYNDIYIASGKYDIGGYPLKPSITFSGDLSVYGTTVFIPDLEIKSFFLPGQSVSIDFPHGFYVETYYPAALTIIDRLYLEFVTPRFYPDFSSARSMAKWHDDVGAITINNIELRKGNFNSKGSGFVGIDNALQPSMRLNTTSSGYDDIVDLLIREQFLTTNDSVIAKAVLRGLSEESPLTGKRVIKAEVKISQQRLFFGPTPVAPLPLFDWDRRNPLVPLQ